MKRFVAVLSGLLVLPAFAEVTPLYYDDAIEMVDTDVVDDVNADVAPETSDATVGARPVAPTAPVARTNRNTTGGRVASRAMPAATTAGTTTRAVAARGNSARTTTARNTTTASRTAVGTVTPRATVSRAAVSRATVGGTGSGAAATANTAASNSATTQSIRRTAPAATAGSAARSATTSSIIQTNTVTEPLYIGTDSSRVGVRANVSNRVPTIRVATGVGVTADATAEATATSTTDMDELAQITDFCKAQYAQCMDNFCNVLDDNQGRCSCSANLSKYEKTETALKQATEELQDVAQKIQYIGLSADEVSTLFTQTEAELQMQKTTDTSQLKSDLDKIKKLIVDVKTPTNTSSDSGISMDLSGLLDFSFGSTGFSLSSFLGGTNTNSVSNQRGEQLFKTAAARCKASVLNSCTAQGVDAALITNAYDLEIDKQCIAYERGLTESNDQMASTVRNAKSVLQKARLMVAQNKNQYGLRDCVSALDACMQDDYVCGADYENCLDPSGKYIVNGTIIVGSKPGRPGGDYAPGGKANDGLYSVWDYTDTAGSKTVVNAWNSNGTLAGFIAAKQFAKTDDFKDASKRADMAGFLQQKIGYIDNNGVAQGMCANVLNKCQNYTYTGKGNNSTYDIKNQVVKEYLERAMVQIKAAQDTKLSEYAENCVADVASCLNQNSNNRYSSSVYWNSSNSNTEQLSKVAIQACMAVSTTCQSVTSAADPNGDVLEWLDKAFNAGAWCTIGKSGTFINGHCLDENGTCWKSNDYRVTERECQ